MQLRKEIPEAALGDDNVWCIDCHLEEGWGLSAWSRQLATDDDVLDQLRWQGQGRERDDGATFQSQATNIKTRTKRMNAFRLSTPAHGREHAHDHNLPMLLLSSKGFQSNWRQSSIIRVNNRGCRRSPFASNLR